MSQGKKLIILAGVVVIVASVLVITRPMKTPQSCEADFDCLQQHAIACASSQGKLIFPEIVRTKEDVQEKYQLSYAIQGTKEDFCQFTFEQTTSRESDQSASVMAATCEAPDNQKTLEFFTRWRQGTFFENGGWGENFLAYCQPANPDDPDSAAYTCNFGDVGCGVKFE